MAADGGRKNADDKMRMENYADTEKMKKKIKNKSRRIVKSNFDYHSKIIHGCFFWTSSDGRLAVKIFAARMNALFGAYTRYGYV